MGATDSLPLVPSYTRRMDADRILRWACETVEDQDTSLVFVAQWNANRVIFRPVADVNARLALPKGYRLTNDDIVRTTQPFADKYAWFRSQTAALRRPWHDGHLQMRVHRDQLVVASMEQLLGIETELIHMTMLVELVEELVVPEGEWLSLIVEQLFEESHGLFVRARGDVTSWTIYPHSIDASVDHLLYFRAVGRMMGRALLGGLSLKTHIARPLLKLVLGEPVTLADVEVLDPEAYILLSRMARYDTSVNDLGLDFSVATRPLDVRQSRMVDLKESGQEIFVTDANKHEYITLRMQYILLDAIAPQLESWLTGLLEVIPLHLLLPFTAEELDRVLFDPPPLEEPEKEVESRDPLKADKLGIPQEP